MDKDLNGKLGVKNVCNLVNRDMKSKFKDGVSKEQTKKYNKYGCEFGKDIKHLYSRVDVVIPVIMACRSPKAIEFRSRLGFNQYDITLKKESSILKSKMEHYEGEDMETQYKVLNYRTDLYFHDYKLAVEVDERGHKDRNGDHEKQK